jgi:transposase
MRKTYDKDFKFKVANEFKISRPIVSRWLAEFNRYGKRAFSGRGNKLPDRAKIHAFEKEIKQLKEEH